MDLVLRKIADASLADKERVIIKVLKTCNLNRYILFDTTYDENGIRSDKHRHVYVFPNLIVNEGDFIWVYTKQGVYNIHDNNSGTKTHNLYMNLNTTIWNNSGDTAYLLHYDDWNSVAYSND